jgi:hypothetical protein
MQKYARIKNNIVVELINIDEVNIKSLSDLYPEEFVKECVPVSSVTSVAPNWVYIDNQFKPPKYDDRCDWSNSENGWVLNKKYLNPGEEYVWNSLKNEWVKVILTPEEFFSKFKDCELLKLKAVIREGNLEASLIEDKLRLIQKFDIRNNDLINVLHKLTTPALGNILSISRFNEIIVTV